MKKPLRLILVILSLSTILIHLQNDVRQKRTNTTQQEGADVIATITEFPQRGILAEGALNIEVDGNIVEFRINFDGVSGKYDGTSVMQRDNEFVVDLIDSDDAFEDTPVVYDLVGRIKNVASGKYTLSIRGASGEIIASQEFEMK